MSTAPNGFQTPKTNWQAADAPLPGDFNRIEGNTQAIEEGQRTIDPSQAPSSNTGTLRQLLDWFANRIKAVTGKPNWYEAPDISLAMLAAHKSRHASGGVDALTPADIGAAPTSHTHSPSQISPQGAGSGLDADTVRGLSPDLFLRAPIIGSWKPTSDTNIVAGGVYTKNIALGAAKSLILSVCRWNVAAQRISDDTSPTNGSVAAVVLSTPSFFAGIGGWPELASSYSAAEIAINTEFRAYMNSSWSIRMRLKVEMVNNTTLRITFTNIASNCNAIVYANSPGIVYVAI